MKKYVLCLSLPLLILDQWTKWLIVSNFPDSVNQPVAPRVIEVIPGFFNIVRVHNTGMAFGVMNGAEHANWIFGLIGLVAMTAISLLWRKNAFPDRISKVAASLLISGILGNLTDRILPGRGYVVDFLDFLPPFYGKLFPSSGGHFPSFNVADSCICIAAALLILSAFRQPGEPGKATPKTESMR
ncbi:MAG TPA: signal peptidase II [Verrucomicrobiales bacterium]|nr:signal peptidase II [Verrucomicrobiales bacterium]